MSDMGLTAAASALEADQTEMSTVAGNLANAATPGYAVERVDQVAVPAAGPTGSAGGVAVVGIDQLRSSLLDSALRTAQAARAATEITQQALSSVQNLFPEPSGDGLGSQLSQLWSDLSTVAASPGNTAAQGVVIEDAAGVASTLNSTYDGLGATSAALVGQIGTGTGSGDLAEANSYLADVASLNGRIVAGSAAGSDVNALVDRRREDLAKLSELIGATARAEPGGAVTVFALGVSLVQDVTASRLQTSGSPPDPPPAAGAAPVNQLGVSTSTGVAVPVGGSVGAALAAVNSTIPAMQSQLSSVANALAGSLDSLQATGVDAAGTPGSSLPTIFVNTGSTGFTPSTSSAGSIAVDPALRAGQIATASASASPAGTATLDGSNAAAMAALASAPGGPDAIYRALVGSVGSAAASANQAASSAQALRDQAATAASAVSGVDTNAQSVDMLQAQQAFQAAAKLTATISTSIQALLAAV